MKVVLTICSANYLAHAKVLGDSLSAHNPDYHFVIGLADRVPNELPRSYWHPYELIPVEEIGIEGMDEMVQRYDVVEFNTAVKPFFMEYLYRRNAEVEAVLYLDPDILICASLAPVVEKLKTHPIIVTPHSSTMDDTPENIYYETGMLSTGVYNLGFLATGRSDTSSRLLQWWQKRLREYCYYAPGTGLFVDQIWITLAPLYFPNLYIEKNPGCNMSYWNVFERRLDRQQGRYVVNGTHDLVFYHFSSFDPEKPGAITKRAKSMTKTFAERPDLGPIYADYSVRLLAADYIKVKSFRYSLRQNPPKSKRTAKTVAKNGFRMVLRALPARAQAGLQRLALLTANSLK